MLLHWMLISRDVLYMNSISLHLLVFFHSYFSPPFSHPLITVLLLLLLLLLLFFFSLSIPYISPLLLPFVLSSFLPFFLSPSLFSTSFLLPLFSHQLTPYPSTSSSFSSSYFLFQYILGVYYRSPRCTRISFIPANIRSSQRHK